MEISNLSVSVGVKSIVYDDEARVYFLVAAGSKVALQGLFSSMASRGSAYLSEDRTKDVEVGFPYGGKMSAIYKRLRTGTFAMAAYHSSVNIEKVEEGTHQVFLCMEGDEKESVLYDLIVKYVTYPLHVGWRFWMWKFLEDNGHLNKLDGYGGIYGWQVALYSLEVGLKKEMVEAVRKGILII